MVALCRRASARRESLKANMWLGAPQKPCKRNTTWVAVDSLGGGVILQHRNTNTSGREARNGMDVPPSPMREAYNVSKSVRAVGGSGHRPVDGDASHSHNVTASRIQAQLGRSPVRPALGSPDVS